MTMKINQGFLQSLRKVILNKKFPYGRLGTSTLWDVGTGGLCTCSLPLQLVLWWWDSYWQQVQGLLPGDRVLSYKHGNSLGVQDPCAYQWLWPKHVQLIYQPYAAFSERKYPDHKGLTRTSLFSLLCRRVGYSNRGEKSAIYLIKPEGQM